jgi:hypothetical protein
MAAMNGGIRLRVALGILAGLGCFALGLGAARLLAVAPPPVTMGDPEGVPQPPPVVAPRIVLDPGAIELLPDASLRLDLPRGFDSGAAEP